MAKPEVDFGTPEEELEYAASALKKAGVSLTQFEAVRETEVNGGTGPAGYSKEMLGLRRWMVQELLAAKMSNRQIANVLKLSKQTVNADRHFNRQLYTEEILKNQDVHRARLLKEQMDLKDLALDSFENSKKKRTITIMEGGDEGGKEMIKIEESAGDASFLNVAKNSLVEQAKLLGLNEIKQEVQQDNSYRKFLKDLSTTIAKEKEANATEERRENSLPAAAEEISFDAEPEKEEWPEAIPLQTINKDDY
jgi:IS30 family transposase